MKSLSPGTTISHYRISELISGGGMGMVYKAVDTSLGRTVAIKVPTEEVFQDAKGRQRFFREAHAVSRLQHPNICTIFEVGEEDGCPYIVMEYVDGPTFHQMIGKSKIAVEPALKLALQVVDALEEAHRSGIIHRDLKPSNVIVNTRGMAKILDFGLAKRLHSADQSSDSDSSDTVMQSLTTEATVIGTVSYMSPEQVRAKTLDARSDVFAFGIVLYEMLTGVRPFTGAGKVEIMHAVLYNDPTAPRKIAEEIDEDLERIVLKCLSKKPADRYQTITEVKADLWRIVREKGYDLSGVITATVTSSGSPRLIDTDATIRKIASTTSRKGIIAGLLVLVAVIGFLVWRWMSRDVFDPSHLRSRILSSWKSDVGNVAATFASFSPDGRRFVYSRVSEGNTDLWRGLITGGEEPIASTQDSANDRSPLYSPDGDRIAFISDREGREGVWVVPEIGGTPQPLFALDGGSNLLVGWSRDGRKLFYDHNYSLFAFDLDSRVSTKVLELTSSRAIARAFSLSPEGDRIAYVDVVDGQRDIWVRPLNGGEATRVTNGPEADDNPVWHPDGKRIIYNSVRDGVSQPYVAFLDGRPPVRLMLLDADSVVDDVSADGTRLLYSTTKDEADVSSVDRESKAVTALTTSVGIELWPVVNRDSMQLAFQSTQSKAIEHDRSVFGIFRQPLSNLRRSIAVSPNGIEPQWSPTRDTIAYVERQNGEHWLWLADMVGAPRRASSRKVFFGGDIRLPYSRVVTRDFDWSPDGSQVAFSDGNEIVSASQDGSSETVLGKVPAAQSPIWSHAGKSVACISFGRGSEGFETSVFIVGQGNARRVDSRSSSIRLVGWSGDDTELIVASVDAKQHLSALPQRTVIEAISVTTGAHRKIYEGNDVYAFNMALTRDGTFIAFVSRRDKLDQLEMVAVSGGPASIVARSELQSYISAPSWSFDGRSIIFSKHSNVREISMIDNFK